MDMRREQSATVGSPKMISSTIAVHDIGDWGL